MTTKKTKIIKNQLILLLSIFGGIAIVISFFAGLYKDWNNLIYPFLFVLGMTIFGLSTLIGIDYYKTIRENRFFSRTPFNEIEKRTIRKIKVSHSKYEFPKTQRIINLDGVEYAVEYYDDIFKIPISDVLLVYDLRNNEFEPKIIYYKKKKYTKAELLEEISGV